MQRILVLGAPGAGKSTLAHQLADQLGLPLHHLDQLHWLPGWIEQDRAVMVKSLQDILVQDRWIIDGNYGATLPLRLTRADTVIWLDRPSWLCIGRALKRWLQYHGRTRPDMTPGCPERLSLRFLLFVFTFRRDWQVRNAAALQKFGGEVVRLTTSAEVDSWLARALASRQ